MSLLSFFQALELVVIQTTSNSTVQSCVTLCARLEVRYHSDHTEPGDASIGSLFQECRTSLFSI